MNNEIFYFFYNFAHSSDLFDKIIFFIAEPLPYIVLASVGLFFLFRNRKDIYPVFNIRAIKWNEIIYVASVGILARLLSIPLKIFFNTERPFVLFQNVVPLVEQLDKSFPSGHSMVFAGVALAMFFVEKKAGYIFFALALLIGVSRIIAGVHFPIDILGGFIIGFAIAYFIKKI